MIFDFRFSIFDRLRKALRWREGKAPAGKTAGRRTPNAGASSKAAATPILEPELEARFLEAPGSRLFAAVLAVCDDEAQEQLESCLDEQLTNEVLRYRTGAVQGILQLKRRLQEYEERARRRESEEETETTDNTDGKE